MKDSKGNLLFPSGHGWSERNQTHTDYGILMHSTNGNQGSSFESEVNFLYKTTHDVCAHFIISKTGEIVQLLPIGLNAWHSGAVSDDHFVNTNSIGIEQHFSPGEDTNVPLMEEAAKRLIWYLMGVVPIYGIETHRKVAIPTGRKQDPSFQTDIQFRMWRDEVFAALIVKTIKKGAILYTAPTRNTTVATHITDPYITNGVFNQDYKTPIKYVANGWVWIPTGIGFVETKNLHV